MAVEFRFEVGDLTQCIVTNTFSHKPDDFDDHSYFDYQKKNIQSGYRPNDISNLYATYGIVVKRFAAKELSASNRTRMDNGYVWWSQTLQREYLLFEDEMEKHDFYDAIVDA